MFRDEIPAPETQETPPGARGDGRLSRQRLPPVESARARAAAYRHLMLLSDATARYDDLNEGQLGDVLFEDGRTVVAIFGSKCDRCGEQHCSWTRCSTPGPAAMQMWLAEVRALAPRLYGVR